MESNSELGQVIAEQSRKIIWHEKTAWERVIRLHVKPKPPWMPERVWRRLLSLVLVQSEVVS